MASRGVFDSSFNSLMQERKNAWAAGWSGLMPSEAEVAPGEDVFDTDEVLGTNLCGKVTCFNNVLALFFESCRNKSPHSFHTKFNLFVAMKSQPNTLSLTSAM